MPMVTRLTTPSPVSLSLHPYTHTRSVLSLPTPPSTPFRTPPHPSTPLHLPSPAGRFVSYPNDVLFSICCHLPALELANISAACRTTYRLAGQTAVALFLEEMGGRHSKYLHRLVMFTLLEKVRRVRTASADIESIKGVLVWASFYGFHRVVDRVTSGPRWNPAIFTKAKRERDGGSALHLAAEMGRLPTVQVRAGKGGKGWS